MTIALDTSPDADAVQIDAHRRMGGAARAQVLFRLGETTRRAAEAGIGSRHPEYDDMRATLALARLLYVDGLVRQAGPDGTCRGMTSDRLTSDAD